MSQQSHSITPKSLTVVSLLASTLMAGCAVEAPNSDEVATCYRGQTVVATSVNGVLFVDGDLEITDFESWCPGETPIKVLTLPEQELQGRRAPSSPGTVWGPDTYGVRWPDGVVPFAIDSAFATSERQAILDAMAEWSRVAPGVSFRAQTTHDPSWVQFKKDSQCSSGYGRIEGERTVRLTSGCTSTYSVHHEIGHALGLQHEHTRSDRDDYVVVSGTSGNYLIDGGADLFGYDFDSVMHYSWSSSISLKEGVTVPPGVTVGQRTHLSEKDIASMRVMYPQLKVKSSVFVTAGAPVQLCSLVGREDDAATKFRLISPGGAAAYEFLGNYATFGSDVAVTVYNRECGARSNFWANDYNYPNSNASAYGPGSSFDELFTDVGNVVLMTAGLIPVLI